MSLELYNKLCKIYPIFEKLIAPLKSSFNITFGYMFVNNDGTYYTISEDLEKVKIYIDTVETSCIFWDKNLPLNLIDEFTFSFWPKHPNSNAMKVYFNCNQWNGLTISKKFPFHTELWWFAGTKENEATQLFLANNMRLLIEYIIYFNSYKSELHAPVIKNDTRKRNDLFLFKKGFASDLDIESSKINKFKVINFLNYLKNSKLSITDELNNHTLTQREYEILSIMCYGFTAKHIASKLNLSLKTVQHHIENIKLKTKTHFKSELIELFRI